MADLYLKALESERRSLWATARLKGLPKDSPERVRILEVDADIAAHKAKSKPVLAKKIGPSFAGKDGRSKSVARCASSLD